MEKIKLIQSIFFNSNFPYSVFLKYELLNSKRLSLNMIKIVFFYYYLHIVYFVRI